MKLLKATKWAYMIFCVLYIITGLVLLIFPHTSLNALSYIAGSLTLILGVVRIIGYFANDLYNIAFQFDLALGVFTLIIGLVFIIRPAWLISLLPFVMGVFLLINGLFSVQSSLDAKKFGLKHWRLLLIFSLFTVLLGAFLVFNPFSGAVFIVRMFGAAGILSGIEKLLIAVYTVSTKSQRARNKITDVDFYDVD